MFCFGLDCHRTTFPRTVLSGKTMACAASLRQILDCISAPAQAKEKFNDGQNTNELRTGRPLGVIIAEPRAVASGCKNQSALRKRFMSKIECSIRSLMLAVLDDYSGLRFFLPCPIPTGDAGLVGGFFHGVSDGFGDAFVED